MDLRAGRARGEQADDAQLRTFAQSLRPTIENHLAMAQNILDDLQED